MLDKSAIARGLRQIDRRARAAGVIVDLSVYGGAALALAFNLRESTRDVDAVVRGAPDFLRAAVAEIAKEEGWPPDWLNDGVKGFLSAREKMELMADFRGDATGGLRLYTPAPEYLFAMKCMAMRAADFEGGHDFADIDALSDLAGIRDVEAALSLVEAFYPAARIPPKVRFGVEEIMERVAARRDRERAESARRIDALADLERAGGVATVFWRCAEGAIRAAGSAGEVDWRAVEREAMAESLNAGQTAPREIAEALCRHSPGAVSPAVQAALCAEVERCASRPRSVGAFQARAKRNPGFNPSG